MNVQVNQPFQPWEQSKTVEEVRSFLEDYSNDLMTITDVARIHGVTRKTANAVANRAGILNIRSKNRKATKQVTTITTLQMEIDKLQQQVKSLEIKKSQLAVKVERISGGELRVYGLTEVPFETSQELVLQFLEHQGPSKMREAVGRSAAAH